MTTSKELKACYRFVNNPKVTEEGLITELINRCSKLTNGRHLIAIQDTTSFNFSNHQGRLKPDSGLGPIEDNYSIGFFLHPTLLLDSSDGTVLGIGDLQIWHRVYDDPSRQRHIHRLPIEEKESFKWIKACQSVVRNNTDAASITFVEDRDGDIYEQFATVPGANIDLVVRSCKERKLTDQTKLFDVLGRLPAQGSYELDVSAEPRKKRISRKAKLEIRYQKVTIQKPDRASNNHLPDSVELTIVEAKEVNYTGKDKVCWKLLTTHNVNSVDDAKIIIHIYKQRWHIEQLFRLLKKQGFAMEDSQLESGMAIRKLCVMAVNVVVRTIQIMLATEDESKTADHVFTKEEQLCMKGLSIELGSQPKGTKNPYREGSLPWAKWVIARLGGWKGQPSQRKAGPITYMRGLEHFDRIYNGWCLALKVFGLVGTQ